MIELDAVIVLYLQHLNSKFIALLEATAVKIFSISSDPVTTIVDAEHFIYL